MGPWQPLAAWAVLISLALTYETYALKKGSGITLSEGVWNFTRQLARHYPYCLTLLGLMIGILLGHFFWCPCAVL